MNVTRRSVVLGTLGALGSTLLTTHASAAPARIALLRPTGACPIGTTAVHLVDHARRDPWHPDRTRELMVTLTYPTSRPRSERVEWMSSAVGSSVDGQLAALGVPPNSVAWEATKRRAYRGAPLDRRELPVVLFSPGIQAPREMYTVLLDDLASRGYAVVSLSHT